MNFLKSTWFSVCIYLFDALIHYLDRKGVIKLEDLSDQCSPFWSEGEFDITGVIKSESESSEEEG